MKITVIGAGNMGGALVRGWIRNVRLNMSQNILNNENELCITARTQKTIDTFVKDFPNILTAPSNAEAVRDADLVVIAVKPWLVEEVANEIRDNIDPSRQAICSVAASVTCEQLSELFGGTTNVYHLIPNIAAEFCQSMTFMAHHPDAPAASVKQVETIFSLVGEVHIVKENMINPGMMMASCGIAYVMRFLRAESEAGVEMGFYPHEALEIAKQTFHGAVVLLRETGLHPEAVIDKVTTPGGYSIRGLNELDHSGFNSAVIRGLLAGMKPRD